MIVYLRNSGNKCVEQYRKYSDSFFFFFVYVFFSSQWLGILFDAGADVELCLVRDLRDLQL
jgi:hypothetical protein